MGNEVVDNEVANDKRRICAENSDEPTSGDVTATVGKRITVLEGRCLGPGRSEKLLLDKLDLLRSINMIEPPASVPGYQIVSVEALLLAGFLLRIVAVFYSGQSQELSLAALGRLLADEGNFEPRDQQSISTIHVLFSLLIYQVILPQAFLLSVRTENPLVSVWQLLIYVVVCVAAIANNAIIRIDKEIIKMNEDLERLVTTVLSHQHVIEETDGCESKGLCFHKVWSTYTNAIIFILIIIYSIKVLYAFRMKQYIVNFEYFGPLLDFFVSKRMRDLVSLIFQAGLLGVNTSGMVYFSESTIHNYIDTQENRDNTAFLVTYLLLDVFANLLCTAGSVGIIFIYCSNHNIYSHGNCIVSTEFLNQKTEQLLKTHEHVLGENFELSREKYYPETRGVAPGHSGQLVRFSHQGKTDE